MLKIRNVHFHQRWCSLWIATLLLMVM